VPKVQDHGKKVVREKASSKDAAMVRAWKILAAYIEN